MPVRLDITGHKYNRLKVLRCIGNRGRYIYWECLCDCGNLVEATTNALRQNNTRSCGCFKLDRMREIHAIADPVKEFWSRVNRRNKSKCWIWPGCKNSSGYGSFQGMGAHVFAYEITFGSHGDLHVLHKCDVRNCVNPNHLFLGTRSDNWNDALSKGRTYFQKYPEKRPRGEKHKNARWTWSQIRRIRKLYATGQYRQIDIARMFNTGQGAISQITRNAAWKE